MSEEREKALHWAQSWDGQLIRAAVREQVLEGQPITAVEWADTRLNSYERAVLYHLLDDRALGEVMQHTLNNVSITGLGWASPAYDILLTELLVPIVVERLKQAELEKLAKVGQ